MKPVVITMPGNERLSRELTAHLDLDHGAVTVRHFPDGESHVRIETPVEGRRAIIVCTLDRPDDKLVPLLLLACAVRETGRRVSGLGGALPRVYAAGQAVSAWRDDQRPARGSLDSRDFDLLDANRTPSHDRKLYCRIY